jgi:putative autotransporter adhesin-like protein
VRIVSRSIGRQVRRRHPWSLGALAGLGLLLLSGWLVATLTRPSAVAQTRSLPPFHAVELAGSNLVDVRVGARQSVVVHAPKAELGVITTRVLDGTLVISDSPGPHNMKGPTSVSVGVPSLDALTIADRGSGIVTMSGVNTPSLTVGLNGSGVLSASGAAGRLSVSIRGSGNIDLGGVVARDVRAVVTGSGRIALTATTSLDASVTGDGVILQYGGSPARLSTRVTGTGVIIPG